MKQRKWIILIPVLMIIILITIYFMILKNKTSYITLDLKGNIINEIELGKRYNEAGFKAKDSIDGDITDKVKIKNNINYKKVGTYSIIYEVKNNGTTTKKERFIKIIKPKNINYKKEYDKIDNSSKEWYFGVIKDNQRPQNTAEKEDVLKKYNAYYIGPNEKTIYLTFDEGSLDTYVDEIVDILNENKVKGTFFFCKTFMAKNPNLIKKIIKTGHSIGNHTANHLRMSDFANKNDFSKYLKEIKENDKEFYKITGKHMEKIYREPRGEYSYRSLQIIKDLGYKSYFWSAAYLDYNDDISKEKAFNYMKNKRHNGAIYLIHPNNKGNYLALEEFIKYMKNKGYKFDLVRNIK